MKTLDAIVASHPVVHTMKPEHQELLCKNAYEIEFKPGEIIFRQGEPANRMFLIQSGKIILEAHEAGGTVPIQNLGTDDVLGWSWLFPPLLLELSGTRTPDLSGNRSGWRSSARHLRRRP